MMEEKDIQEYHNIGLDIKWNKQFKYPSSTRSLINDQRHYDVNEQKLPSVTTILSATQTEEKKLSLANWQQKVGKNVADGIRDQAAERGTIMHRCIEGLLLGQRHADLSDLGQQAGVMAQTVYDEGLKGKMTEIWGSESCLYYPGLYAGTCDLTGIYGQKQAIVDFKQTNRPKKREWISDYFLQLAGYALAHNYVYKTDIQFGIILMCSKDNFFQTFEIEGEEFQHYMWEWLRRVSKYYEGK